MMRRLLGFSALQFLLVFETESFSVLPQYNNQRRCNRSSDHQQQSSLPLPSSSFRTADQHDAAASTTKSDQDVDDQELLKTIKKDQLIDMCKQYGVTFQYADKKRILLARLREHANREAEAAKERLLARRQRVEENESPKERYESLDNGLGDEEDDDEAVFFYYDPTVVVNNTTASSGATDSTLPPPSNAFTRAEILAPPTPDGADSVTIYDSEDLNDLTGIANAQPGKIDPDMGSGEETSPAWDMPQNKRSSKEYEKATEEVSELIGKLLASTGAPAFMNMYEDDDDDDYQGLLVTGAGPLKSFVGFNPSKIPPDLLTSKSSVLRTGRGQVLQDVLYQYEMRAVAQDGANGDDRRSGGGNYAEVCKVRAFVEGFRLAEVRRLVRETTTILLEKLMQEGVGGLDFALSTMARSDDDTGDYAGELNDSLLDFLNDAIRHQEKKVDQLVAERFREDDEDAVKERLLEELSENDPVNQLWNVTVEDGQTIESIDPNDPEVRMVLQDEYDRQSSSANKFELPETAPEKVLLLLTLLRERVKAEAAFAPDEKGRNLRLLAYCLRLDDEQEREGLILKHLGNSLDVSAWF
jgi:hypothetical protein